MKKKREWLKDACPYCKGKNVSEIVIDKETFWKCDHCGEMMLPKEEDK